MNVASLELCKELFELSGWGETEHMHWRPTPMGDLDPNKGIAICPAYSLGYLLRKLPDNASVIKRRDDYGAKLPSESYRRGFLHDADTPEEASIPLCHVLKLKGVSYEL